MRKRFDKQLYEENDKICRDKVKELLKDYSIIDNPKKMGVDLITDNFYVECERKLLWKDKFPFENINFPERKAKYCKLDKPTVFIMFNHDLTQYLIVKGKDLLASPLEIVPNKYISYGEKFFKVSLDKVTFNNINCIKE